MSHQLQKSNTTSSLVSDFGGKRRLGNFANLSKELNPTAELLLAKDYNTKVNRYGYYFQYPRKQVKNCTLPSECDPKLKEILKENFDRITSL